MIDHELAASRADEFAACPECGSVVLLEEETSTSTFIAPLHVAPDDKVVWDQMDGTAVDEDDIGSEVIGCASCGATFDHEDTTTESRSARAAFAELRSVVQRQQESEPSAATPWVDQEGNPRSEIGSADTRVLTCSLCGGNRWLIAVADFVRYGSLWEPDEEMNAEQDIISSGIHGFAIVGCAGCMER